MNARLFHLPLLLLLLDAAPALHAQATVGEVFAEGASIRGTVALSQHGMRLLSGSQVTAGDGTALVRLDRGGQLRVCPRTALSLSLDPAGKTLVMGMNTGAMELEYSLAAGSDSLLTPDFRLQLISPGDFHLAISVTPSGDTCLRSLEGNTASVFVAEMMGTESYQLAPGRHVVLKGGRIAGAVASNERCGCPEMPREAVMAPEPASPAATLPPLPANGGNSHMEVESTFVFHGDAHEQDLAGTVSRLRLSEDNSQLALALLPQVAPPQAATTAATPEKKEGGWLHRVGGWLHRAFGKRTEK